MSGQWDRIGRKGQGLVWVGEGGGNGDAGGACEFDNLVIDVWYLVVGGVIAMPHCVSESWVFDEGVTKAWGS